MRRGPRRRVQALSAASSPSQSRLSDRVGALQWTKTASGGKFRHLLRERAVSQSEMTGHWDALLGYVGPPRPKKGSPEIESRLASADVDYRKLQKPLCLKSLPRRSNPVSATQALLYMKLRDSQYPKSEALKHSSTQRFKTDTGLKSGLYTFHGLSLRVPVTDPEKRFTPYFASEDNGDYERLSRAYDQFLRKYRVESGELEARKNSERQLRLNDFQEKPKAPWMMSREKHEIKKRKQPASVPTPATVLLTPQLSLSSVSSEAEDLFPLEVLPISPAAPSPQNIGLQDEISRVDSFSGGSIVFRALSPSPPVKKAEPPRRRWPEGRKSTLVELDSGLKLITRSNRRASTLMVRSTGRFDL